MPRDGSGIYTQPFPNVVDGTTIESAVYNGFTNDVALQLNGPIPVSAGGTGGNSAASAATNLGVVTGKAVMTYTEAEKTQARANIYAAPFDALAYNGMQVNGSMEVSQERGGAGSSTSGTWICDSWLQYWNGTMTLTSVGGPLSNFIPGFGGLLYMTTPTPQASIGAGDYAILSQRLEGWRTVRLAWGTASAQPVTIGFWTAHYRTGLYTGTVRNQANTRSYAFTYTHNASAIAQYNIITIPGCVDGVWPVDNTIGMILTFALACGATNAASSANAWVTGGYLAGPGQINAVATTSDVFRITGVVVLPGSEAPSAARSPLIMRPVDQELLTCQRYYQYAYVTLDTQATGAGIYMSQGHKLAPAMRASPAIAVAGTDAVANVGVPVFSAQFPQRFLSQVTTTAAGRCYWFAVLSADARL
jgi:hypothetical protein